MEKLNMKKEVLMLILGILYVVALISFFRYMHFGKVGVIVTLCIISLIFNIYAYIKHKVFNFKALLFGFGYIIGIVYLISFLGKYGWVGYILSCGIISFAILYRKRKKYFEVKHRIESMLFGEPLHKFRERGEKPPSIGIK